MTTAPPPTCPACHSVNDRDYVNCRKCGARRAAGLSAAGPAPAPARPTAPRTVATPVGGADTVPPARQGPPTTKAAPTAHGATRYLCCAMQLDSGLARRAVEQIVEEPRRAVASSPGIDLACVLAYALAARSRQLGRDCALAVLLVFIVLGLGGLGGSAVLLGLLLAWAVVAGELFYVYYGVIVPKLDRKVFDPAAAPVPASPAKQARLREIAQRDHGNVTVFPAFAPFTGYGKSMEAWSFAVRTDRPVEGSDVVLPFEVHDLYSHVAAAVEELRLPGVRVEDRLFVNGADLRRDAVGDRLLPAPERAPVPAVPPAAIRELRAQADGTARPYLALQVVGWDGELVSTQFLRFALLPHQDVLFVENSTSLLAPVREAYRMVDTLLDRPTFRQGWALVMGALPRTVALLLRSVPAVLGGVAAAMADAYGGKETKQLREIRHRGFNYGAPMSIREAASDHLYYRYYQKIDREMYTKVISRRALDSLVEFLEAHDIDTSELRKHQTTIHSNGLFVGANSSLSINGSAVAVGQNAVGRVFQEAGARVSGGTAGRRD